MLIALEEQTHAGQTGHEEEMNQIDIQRATAYILQRGADDGHLGEVVLVVAEIHQGDEQQEEHGSRLGDDSPRHTQGAPFQGIHRTEDSQQHDDGEEPLRVHQFLETIPIAMGNITKEEERHPQHQLPQTGIQQELMDIGHAATITLGP